MNKEELERLIASLQESTKVLDGKVVIEASVLEEIRKANTETSTRVAELEKTNAAMAEKVEVLESEKATNEAKAYVANKEAEIATAAAAKEVEDNRRKSILKDKGFESEKIVASALKRSKEDFEAYLSELDEAKEVAKAAALKDVHKQVRQNQDEFLKVKDDNAQDAEMNLAEELPKAEKIRKAVSAKLKEAKAKNRDKK